MKSFGLYVALFLFAAARAAAQESVAAEQPPAMTTVVVPAVGSVFGPNLIRWQTDVEIVNDTGAAADVLLELSTAPDSPVMLFTMAPGDVQRFPDVVVQAFGLESALSPLRVITSGRRAVTVRATVYAITSEGISPLQPVGVYYGASYFPLRALDGLAFSDEFRTNIGLVNFDDAPADFTLTLQRVQGRNVAITHLRVPPLSLLHTSVQSAFPMITQGDDFTILVETASPETLVYASVVENETNAGRFVAARIGTR